MLRLIYSLSEQEKVIRMSSLPNKVLQYIGANFDAEEERIDDKDWLKGAILHRALVTKKDGVEAWRHWTCFKKIAPVEEVAAFKADMLQVIYPLILTPHGFKRGLATFDQAKVWAEVKEMTDMLRDRGSLAFVNSGTLLGLIREKALLVHDDDIDIGILLKAETAEQAADEIVELMEALESWVNWGYVEWSSNNLSRPSQHIQLKSSLAPIDLFPCWIEGGEFYAYPHGTIDPQKVLPLAEREIEGVKISVPADPEAFLELCYGPGWRTPDEGFTYPWSRAAKTFEPFCNAHRIVHDERIHRWPLPSRGGSKE